MDKKVLIALVAGVLVFVGGFSYWNMTRNADTGSGASEAVASGRILYYGAECPHCKDVEKFIDDNKLADKVPFQKKEVWHDQGNAKEMTEKATSCGLAENAVGVPFLYADGKCYVGTPDVEGYFQQQAGRSSEAK